MEVCECFQDAGWIEKSNAETRVAMAATNNGAGVARLEKQTTTPGAGCVDFLRTII